VAERSAEERVGAHSSEGVEIPDGFVYDEPPAWYYPVRESLGAELVGSGKSAEGEAVMREDCAGLRNGSMLLAVDGEALRAQGERGRMSPAGGVGGLGVSRT
jgi:hypothetical protein